MGISKKVKEKTEDAAKKRPPLLKKLEKKALNWERKEHTKWKRRLRKRKRNSETESCSPFQSTSLVE
jgi:hypothetical protein